MQDCKFWRIVTVLGVAAVFYVGHGLHNSGSNGVPSLENTAHAGDVAVAGGHGVQRIYTTGPEGRTLYSWQDPGDGQPRIIGEANAQPYEYEVRKRNWELRQRERQHEVDRVLTDPAKAGLKPEVKSDK